MTAGAVDLLSIFCPVSVKEDFRTAEDLPKVFLEGNRMPAVKVNKIIRLDTAVEELEKELIRMAVEEYGTTVKAAEILGVNQSTVSRKMAQYHLKEEARNFKSENRAKRQNSKYSEKMKKPYMS